MPEALWHLPLRAVRSVSVLDRPRKLRARKATALPPSDSRQNHDLRDDLDQAALL